MGVLFEALHETLDERVVIKFVRAADLDELALTRFEREARIAVKLRTEHVARILDAGRDDSGDPFIVMEHLVGIDLWKLVRERGRLRADVAAEYLVQACHGLAEAHALGIVHRDVKPANLFLARDPAGLDVVKVLDFGISKAADCGGDGLTASPERAVQLLGTPSFASPEQLVAPQAVDPRADIWSLGVTAWYLVTGELPFRSRDLATLMRQVLDADVPVLSDVRSDVPEPYARALSRCLEKRREARFASMAELAEAFAEASPARLDALVEHTRLLLAHGRARTSDTPAPLRSDPALDFGATQHERRRASSVAPPPPPPAPPPSTVPLQGKQPPAQPWGVSGPSTSVPVTLQPEVPLPVAPSQSTSPSIATSAPTYSRVPMFAAAGAIVGFALAAVFVLKTQRPPERLVAPAHTSAAAPPSLPAEAAGTQPVASTSVVAPATSPATPPPAVPAPVPVPGVAPTAGTAAAHAPTERPEESKDLRTPRHATRVAPRTTASAAASAPSVAPALRGLPATRD